MPGPQDVDVYVGSLDDTDALQQWIADHRLPLVPTLDAGLAEEFLGRKSSRPVVLLLADPASPGTAEAK